MDFLALKFEDFKDFFEQSGSFLAVLLIVIVVCLSVSSIGYVVLKFGYEIYLRWCDAIIFKKFKHEQCTTMAEFKRRVNLENLKIDKVFLLEEPRTIQTVEARMNSILDMSLEELREELSAHRVNPYTVLCAYVWRALIVNQHLNCITGVIKDAFERAENIDHVRDQNRSGPLYGIPFSVKSNFYVAGYHATIGLAGDFKKEKQPRNCGLVEFLIDQGAIPFCFTNVPQGLLSYVTSNPLCGTTKNPWDFTRTPGGSSGGEAALVAAGGAAFGIGNDLVGSLRIPAAFCGLVSLKPTQGRLYEDGMNPGLEGRGRLGMSSGFFTRNVKDQEFLLNCTIGHPKFCKLNPCTSKAKLELITEERALKVGIMTNNPFSQVSRSNACAVEEAVSVLERRGCIREYFDIEKVSEDFAHQTFDIAEMLFRNVMPDNGAYMSSLYTGEPYDRHMRTFINMIRLKQNCVCNFLANYLVLPFVKLTRWRSERFACLSHAHNNGVNGVRENQERTDNFKKAWIRYWKQLEIDVLVCPSFITPAQPFEYPGILSTGVFTTGLFNMLDCPAGVVPVMPVTSDENEFFDANGDYVLAQQRLALQNTRELPNSVQIVALPNDEEMCLKVMRMVEEGMARRTNPPADLKWKGPNVMLSEVVDGDWKQLAMVEHSDSEQCFQRVLKRI